MVWEYSAGNEGVMIPEVLVIPRVLVMRVLVTGALIMGALVILMPEVVVG